MGRTSVSVPEVCTSITSGPLVPKSVSLLDRALSYEGNTVRILATPLPDSMPMDGNLHSLHSIHNIDDHLVALTNLQHVQECKKEKNLKFVFLLTLLTDFFFPECCCLPIGKGAFILLWILFDT